MPPCHHTWHQKGKDVVSNVNGVEFTRFTHECPACGKVKVTVRASRRLPPEIMWKRELEKLTERAAAQGHRYIIAGVPLVLEAITIEKVSAKHEDGQANLLRPGPGAADTTVKIGQENSGGAVPAVQQETLHNTGT